MSTEEQPAEGNDPPADEFADPLSNYDPVSYEDPLEKALNEERVPALQSTPFITVRTEDTVRAVLEKMTQQSVSCVLVLDAEGQLKGIFGERDVLDRVALELKRVIDRSIQEIMTPQPVYVYDTDSVASTLCVMANYGYRHVPVLNTSEEVVGIVSPRRISTFLQETIRRNSAAGDA